MKEVRTAILRLVCLERSPLCTSSLCTVSAHVYSPVSVRSAIGLVTFLFLGREIPSFFILEIRLVLGNPSRAEAPSGPPISQPVSSNVRKIRDRRESLNIPDGQL